eukprot:236912-Heterocapsa_arctica.AAC.1
MYHYTIHPTPPLRRNRCRKVFADASGAHRELRYWPLSVKAFGPQPRPGKRLPVGLAHESPA